ncbi:hypothetical protein BC827DRAFT_1138969 [Russula dissimulans]|nr:hypothetical protein BC827DRAFT_1138969 [Russula dissimulans]
MPFANLPAHEKDAFFALLDEYFTSRPDLLSSLQVGGAGGPEHAEAQGASPAVPAAAITAAQRALANPTTSRFLATGLQRASTNNLNANADAGRSAGVNPAAAAAAATAATSVAAAALPSLLSSSSSLSSLSSSSRPAAQNVPSAENGESAPVPGVSKFGDVDVSSAGAMFRSLRGSTAAKNAPPPTVHTPPAFSGGKKASSAFAPPPVRRVGPSSSSSPASAAPEPEEDAPPESVENAGEWAEALYDYTSEEAGDLHLRTGERVLVTEQTSSDWWTGEVDGRSGLFPATYVKLL